MGFIVNRMTVLKSVHEWFEVEVISKRHIMLI